MHFLRNGVTPYPSKINHNKAAVCSSLDRGFYICVLFQLPIMKLFVLLLCCMLSAGIANAQVIEVSAGAHTRSNVPLKVTLNKRLPANTQYQLVNEQTGAKTPAQLIDSNELVFILPEKLLPGTSAQYVLQPVAANTFKNSVTVETESAGLMVMVKDQPLLFYHITEVAPPADSPCRFRVPCRWPRSQA